LSSENGDHITYQENSDLIPSLGEVGPDISPDILPSSRQPPTETAVLWQPLPLPPDEEKDQWNVDDAAMEDGFRVSVKVYFHYGCALRCVAFERRHFLGSILS